MKVLVSDILAKVNDLPSDFRDHVAVEQNDRSIAYVRSFSADTMYTVHIKTHDDDPGDKSILRATCPCVARTLCKHVVAFYAVSKGIGPPIGVDMPSDVPESNPPDETDQVPAKEPIDALRTLTMAAINTEMKAHEARVAMLLEVERIARET